MYPCSCRRSPVTVCSVECAPAARSRPAAAAPGPRARRREALARRWAAAPPAPLNDEKVGTKRKYICTHDAHSSVVVDCRTGIFDAVRLPQTARCARSRLRLRRESPPDFATRHTCRHVRRFPSRDEPLALRRRPRVWASAMRGWRQAGPRRSGCGEAEYVHSIRVCSSHPCASGRSP